MAWLEPLAADEGGRGHVAHEGGGHFQAQDFEEDGFEAGALFR